VRSGAAADHDGYYHETAFYDSDDDFIDIVAPFVSKGVAAGEPTIVACGDRNTGLLQSAVGDAGVSYLPGADLYGRPGPTIRTYRAMFDELLAGGAGQIRVIGDVPHPGVGTSWHGWLRYEAAANKAFSEYPLWGLCPYDTRTTPEAVLADVSRLHPHVADRDGGHHHNDLFVDPADFVLDHPTAKGPPGDRRQPVLAFTEPTAGDVRSAIRNLAAGVLSQAETDSILVAASEAVLNAYAHGVSPVEVQLWSDHHGLVIDVADRGPGPADPLVGLLPPIRTEPGGRGLWIVNQLCSDVEIHYGDGFRIQLRMTANQGRQIRV
jgi:anti-sigma regulatory factor (Ser/Thr protein kinase)